MNSNLALNQIKDILIRISKGEEVTLKERFFIQKTADSDQKIMSWLKKARRLQNGIRTEDSIDNLLNDLALSNTDYDSMAKPDPEDLGNWFSGAPSWVARS